MSSSVREQESLATLCLWRGSRRNWSSWRERCKLILGALFCFGFFTWLDNLTFVESKKQFLFRLFLMSELFLWKASRLSAGIQLGETKSWLCVWWLVQGEDHICCSALSPCGSWMAYSMVSGVRLYKLQHNNNNIGITRVPPQHSHCSQCSLQISSEIFIMLVVGFMLKLIPSSSFPRCPNYLKSFPQPTSSASPRTHPSSLPPPVVLQSLLLLLTRWSANTFTPSNPSQVGAESSLLTSLDCGTNSNLYSQVTETCW